jgi:hypothetical protein
MMRKLHGFTPLTHYQKREETREERKDTENQDDEVQEQRRTPA